MGKGLCLLSGKASCSPGTALEEPVTLCCDALSISVSEPLYPFLNPVPLLLFGGAQAGPASHPWAEGMAVPWAGSSTFLCAAPHPAAIREDSRALPVGLELLIPSLSACHLELLGALLRPSLFPE